eukprot:403371387
MSNREIHDDIQTMTQDISGDTTKTSPTKTGKQFSYDNIEAFPIQDQSIDDIYRECKELLQSKQGLGEKIRELKFQLRKANRDQQFQNQQSEKAATQTSALAQNSSIVEGEIPKEEDLVVKLGKRNLREELSKIDSENTGKDEGDSEASKRSKLTESAVQGLSEKSQVHDQEGRKETYKEETEEMKNLKELQDSKLIVEKTETAAQIKQDQNPQQQLQTKKTETSDRNLDSQRNQNTNQNQNTQARSQPPAMGIFGRGGGRNPLSNMLFRHLEKAKVNLEQEKDLFKKQTQIVQKVTQKLQKDSNVIQEVQLSEIEDKMNQEIEKKRDLERKLIIANEQMRNQKELQQMDRISKFIQTKAQPAILWMPAKHSEKTVELQKETKESFEQKKLEFKQKCKDRLVERLKQFDQRMEEYNQQRKVRVIDENFLNEYAERPVSVQNAQSRRARPDDEYIKDRKTNDRDQRSKERDRHRDQKQQDSVEHHKEAVQDYKDDLEDELDDDIDGDYINDIYNMK